LTASEARLFDAAFTRAMSTDAVGRSFRCAASADRTFDPVVFTGIDAKPGNGVIDAMIANLLSLGGNPLVLDIFSPTAQPVRAPLVVDPTDPTPDITVQAAIRGLAQTNPQLVLTDLAWLKPRPQGPATILIRCCDAACCSVCGCRRETDAAPVAARGAGSPRRRARRPQVTAPRACCTS
jgi:hypothetical protein